MEEDWSQAIRDSDVSWAGENDVTIIEYDVTSTDNELASPSEEEVLRFCVSEEIEVFEIVICENSQV